MYMYGARLCTWVIPVSTACSQPHHAAAGTSLTGLLLSSSQPQPPLSAGFHRRRRGGGGDAQSDFVLLCFGSTCFFNCPAAVAAVPAGSGPTAHGVHGTGKPVLVHVTCGGLAPQQRAAVALAARKAPPASAPAQDRALLSPAPLPNSRSCCDLAVASHGLVSAPLRLSHRESSRPRRRPRRQRALLPPRESSCACSHSSSRSGADQRRCVGGATKNAAAAPAYCSLPIQ